MSFRVKTILGVALIEAILLGFLVWQSVQFLTGSIEDGLTKRAVTTSRLFADAAKDAVISVDLATLESLVNDLVRNPDIVYVRVIGEGSGVLAQAGDAPPPDKKIVHDESYETTTDGVYDISHEISEANSVFGRVELGFSITPLNATIDAAKRNIVSIALTEMVFVAIFSFILGIYLTRQLRQLSEASRKISQGKFGYQVEVRGRDELAETATAFNTMSTRISSLYDQVSESERRSRTIVEVALDSIISMDRNGRVIEFNPAAEACFRYRREDVIGQDLAELIIPERFREAHRKGLEHYLKTNEGPVLGQRLELTGMRADGSEFPTEIAIQAEQSQDGTVFIAYLRDVTEQKRAEAELIEAKERAESANAVKSEFLAMMSHEIRTPINAVIGSLGLLDETDLDEEQRNYTRTSRRSSDALLGLINDILDFSKMEAGRFEFYKAPFKTSEILDSISDIVSIRAESKGISFHTDADDKIPTYLVGDFGRIRQILLNLAGNAVKFTEKGSVTVSVKLLTETATDATILFEIIDTGIGISAENHGELFKEFTTITPAYTQKFGGTGLGLAISKTLADLMEGELDFESELNQGSRFWFRVRLPKLTPAAIEEMELDATRSEAVKDIKLSGRILLAEDNPANQMVTKTTLEKAGLRVEVAANGLEAVAAARARPFDLILMDIGMPELDGIGATERIRSLDTEKSKTPIVAMTAHVMQGDRSALLAKGMDGYLAKPVARENLLSCVRDWLEQKKPQETAPQNLSSPSGQSEIESDHSEIIDVAALHQLGEDTDKSLLPQLIGTFLTHAQKQVDALAAAANNSDFETIKAEAHSLKSSSVTFGALRLHSLAKQIEIAGKAQNADAARDLGTRINMESSLAFEGLKSFLNDQNDSDTI